MHQIYLSGEHWMLEVQEIELWPQISLPTKTQREWLSYPVVVIMVLPKPLHPSPLEIVSPHG